MTRCSIQVFVSLWDVSRNLRLGYVPDYRDSNHSRVHLITSPGKLVGRTLCSLGRLGTPFVPAPIDAPELPCAVCFDKARALTFRFQRKAEEKPGTL